MVIVVFVKTNISRFWSDKFNIYNYSSKTDLIVREIDTMNYLVKN